MSLFEVVLFGVFGLYLDCIWYSAILISKFSPAIKATERLEELVLQQKQLHEEMLANQRAEFHKENLKLLNKLRQSEAPVTPDAPSNTNLYIAVALLGGSLVGVLIAVATCYLCRRESRPQKDRTSNGSGNALHMTIWFF